MVDTGVTAYLTTEFGAGLALAALIVAFLCWRRRDVVSPSPTSAGGIAPSLAAD